MASRNIFQMDQTASENQKVFWHIRKRCQNPNMDCHLGLCSGSDHEKTSENRIDFVHNFTDSEHISF
jgi:hypothetical protein